MPHHICSSPVPSVSQCLQITITLFLFNSSHCATKGHRFPFCPLCSHTAQLDGRGPVTLLCTQTAQPPQWASLIRMLYIPYLDFRWVRHGWERAGRPKRKGKKKMLLSWFPVKASKVVEMKIGLLGAVEGSMCQRALIRNCSSLSPDQKQATEVHTKCPDFEEEILFSRIHQKMWKCSLCAHF